MADDISSYCLENNDELNIDELNIDIIKLLHEYTEMCKYI